MFFNLTETIPLTLIQKSEAISKDGLGEGINRLPKLDLEKHCHDKSSVRDGGKQQLLSQKEQKNQCEVSE